MKRYLISWIVCSILCISGYLAAQTTFVTPNNWSGSEPVSAENVSGWSNFKISWNITQNGSTYTYIYKITNTSGGSLSSSLSAFYLQVYNDVTTSNLSQVINNPSVSLNNPALLNYSGIEGVSFNTTNSTATIQFTSNRTPDWGSFLATGSNDDTYASNANVGTEPGQGTTDFSGWVPTPGSAVPEPSTWLLMISMVAIAVFAKSYLVKKA